MGLARQAAIVGVYEHPARFAPNKTAFQLMAESARGALADAGLSLKEVDGLCSTGLGFGATGIVSLCEYLNLKPGFVDSTAIGGASFVAHAAHAAAAIAAGLCSVVLVVYGSTAASQRLAIGTAGIGSADPADQYETPFGPTTVASYALVAARHMHEYGTTAEQLAEIAVTTRMHAGLNPQAKYREPITVEDVLASRMIASPLRLLDCCIISDGAGAFVMTSAERARELRRRPIWLLGAGEAVGHGEGGLRDYLKTAAAQSGRAALARAGVAHREIDLAMIYDSFTITVLVTLENLGFCRRGEGGSFVSGGRLRFDGALPVNTDGGGLSSNHPGMRGVFLVIEAVRQLRGEAGPAQVGDCRIALVHGTGGTLGLRHSGATLVLAN